MGYAAKTAVVRLTTCSRAMRCIPIASPGSNAHMRRVALNKMPMRFFAAQSRAYAVCSRRLVPQEAMTRRPAMPSDKTKFEALRERFREHRCGCGDGLPDALIAELHTFVVNPVQPCAECARLREGCPYLPDPCKDPHCSAMSAKWCSGHRATLAPAAGSPAATTERPAQKKFCSVCGGYIFFLVKGREREGKHECCCVRAAGSPAPKPVCKTCGDTQTVKTYTIMLPARGRSPLIQYYENLTGKPIACNDFSEAPCPDCAPPGEGGDDV